MARQTYHAGEWKQWAHAWLAHAHMLADGAADAAAFADGFLSLTTENVRPRATPGWTPPSAVLSADFRRSGDGEVATRAMVCVRSSFFHVLSS